MTFKHVILSGILLASSGLARCGGGYVAYRVPAPPAPRVVGAFGFAPGPGYVWMDGFWDLRGSRWVWVDGRWGRPPRAGAVWVPDRWERHGDGWRHNRGRWR
jgi:hypothetical protein